VAVVRSEEEAMLLHLPQSGDPPPEPGGLDSECGPAFDSECGRMLKCRIIAWTSRIYRVPTRSAPVMEKQNGRGAGIALFRLPTPPTGPCPLRLGCSTRMAPFGRGTAKRRDLAGGWVVSSRVRTKAAPAPVRIAEARSGLVPRVPDTLHRLGRRDGGSEAGRGETGDSRGTRPTA
jgi:hypothetical protein